MARLSSLTAARLSRAAFLAMTAATVAAVDDDVRKFLADRVRNADDFLRRQIEKIEMGMLRNMDLERFSIQITEGKGE